jgi:hypothetical protein
LSLSVKEGLATEEKTGDAYRKIDKNDLITGIGKNNIAAGAGIKILDKN